MRAYQVINGWQGGQLANMNGTKPSAVANPQSITTERFNCESIPWALVWSLRGTELKVSINNSKTHSHLLAQVSIDSPQGGQGISYFYEAGTFDLAIEGEGEWSIKVALVEEVGERA